MKAILHLSYLAVLLCVAIARAPGDADTFCTNGENINVPAYSSNIKVLMDSFNYLNLLPPLLGSVWQHLDLDDNNAIGSSTEVWIYFYREVEKP